MCNTGKAISIVGVQESKSGELISPKKLQACLGDYNQILGCT